MAQRKFAREVSISETLLQQSLAFVLREDRDSVCIAYRSKDNYNETKPSKATKDGLLRLVTFETLTSNSDLLEFIEKEVDVVGGISEWCMVGNGRRKLQNEIELKFNIRTRKLSDSQSLARCVQHPLPSLPPNPQSVLAATKIEVSLKENLKAKGVPKPFYVSEMQENGAERWVERYLEDSKDLEAPCVLLHLDLSATLYYVDEKLRLRVVDASAFGTASVKAICSHVLHTKPQDFEKILQLAEDGDPRHLTIFWRDIRSSGPQEKNYYYYNDDIPSLELAKLITPTRIECSEEDKAACFISFFMFFISKAIIPQAQLLGVERVYACGEIFENGLVKREFERRLLSEAMGEVFNGENYLKLNVLKNPAHVVLLGAWWV